ncbi:hypothetical protein L1987_47925 [Smallanthus sonchifolius]|uniref:Uncharacterized protein n=1 Tax=Smallanthus sonchifolius TaxID=185202 RepID=A0ACB9FR40_9ASTR|nr:hypothetical protein L1987_47925 [Smallanthus sonchifolius]
MLSMLRHFLCRKRAVDRSLDDEQWGLVAWVQDSIKEGNLKGIIDSGLSGEISPKCLKEFVGMAEVLVNLESVFAKQEKFNNSLQSAGRTIFGRLVDMLPFPSNRENSVQGDSSNSKGNNMFPEMKEVPADFQIKRLNQQSLQGHAEWLTEDFNAKLGDFGLVKYGPETGETHVSTGVMGTYGYAAPEYISTGHLTIKSDIYGLGMVLLESITGRKAMDASRPIEDRSLVEWVTRIQSNGRNLTKIMDPRLEDNYVLQGASKCFALALRCVVDKPKDRPSSEEVLQSLEQIYALNR